MSQILARVPCLAINDNDWAKQLGSIPHTLLDSLSFSEGNPRGIGAGQLLGFQTHARPCAALGFGRLCVHVQHSGAICRRWDLGGIPVELDQRYLSSYSCNLSLFPRLLLFGSNATQSCAIRWGLGEPFVQSQRFHLRSLSVTWHGPQRVGCGL
jgi:hypothetical protein